MNVWLDIILNMRVWFILSIAFLIVYALTGGLGYINCLGIIEGYINIFKQNNKIEKKHLLFFMGFPGMLSTATNLSMMITSEVSDIICVVISVLTAIMYVFMGTVDAKKSSLSQNENYLDYNYIVEVHDQTIDIILYETILSVVLLILCFTYALLPNFDYVFIDFGKAVLSIRSIESWIIYYCFYSFVLNLLIITKRVYKIEKN